MPVTTRPRWQRARLLRDPRCNAGPPPVGFLFWVRTGPPMVAPDRIDLGGLRITSKPALRYQTNIRSPMRPLPPGIERLSDCVIIAPEVVELLARGPEDFCDDPPRIPWGAWTGEGGGR